MTASLAEAVEELTHFASAFSHQRQNCQVSRGATRHHADQRALANAAATEDTESLSPSAGEESINSADAATQRLANRQTIEGRRRGAIAGTDTPMTIANLTALAQAARRSHRFHQIAYDLRYPPLP